MAVNPAVQIYDSNYRQVQQAQGQQQLANIYSGIYGQQSAPIQASANPLLSNIQQGNTAIQNPYTRALIERGIENGQVPNYMSPESRAAEEQRRIGVLRQAVIPAGEAATNLGMRAVESNMQKAGKLSSSGANQAFMQTSEMYGAQMGASMAQGTLDIYGQVSQEALQYSQLALQSGISQAEIEAQLQMAGLSAETSRYISELGEQTKRDIATIEAASADRVAQINSDAALSSYEKDIAIAQIESQTQQQVTKISGQYGTEAANIGAEAQKYSADVGAEAQMYGANVGAEAQKYSADVGAKAQRYAANIGAKAQKYGADIQLQVSQVRAAADERINQIQADTTLSVTDKNLLLGFTQLDSEQEVAKINIGGARNVAEINAASGNAIATIQANTAISVADKNEAIATLQTKAQKAIATLQTSSAERISTESVSAQKTMQGLQLGFAREELTANIGLQENKYKAELKSTYDISSMETLTNRYIVDQQSATVQKVAQINTEMDSKIAQIQADTTLSAAQKQVDIANIQKQSAKDVADINAASDKTIADITTESNLEITKNQMANAKDITELNNINNLAMEAQRKLGTDSVAKIQKSTVLEGKDKDAALERARWQNDTIENSYLRNHQIALSKLEIQGAKDLATADKITQQALQYTQNLHNAEMTKLNNLTTLSVVDKQAEMAKLKNANDFTIANIQRNGMLANTKLEIKGAKDAATVNRITQQALQTTQNMHDTEINRLNNLTTVDVAEKNRLIQEAHDTTAEDIANIQATSALAVETMNAQTAVTVANMDMVDVVTYDGKGNVLRDQWGNPVMQSVPSHLAATYAAIDADDARAMHDVPEIGADGKPTGNMISEPWAVTMANADRMATQNTYTNDAGESVMEPWSVTIAKYGIDAEMHEVTTYDNMGNPTVTREPWAVTMQREGNTLLDKQTMHTYNVYEVDADGKSTGVIAKNPDGTNKTITEPWETTKFREDWDNKFEMFDMTEMTTDAEGNEIPKWMYMFDEDITQRGLDRAIMYGPDSPAMEGLRLQAKALEGTEAAQLIENTISLISTPAFESYFSNLPEVAQSGFMQLVLATGITGEVPTDEVLDEYFDSLGDSIDLPTKTVIRAMILGMASPDRRPIGKADTIGDKVTEEGE